MKRITLIICTLMICLDANAIKNIGSTEGVCATLNEYLSVPDVDLSKLVLKISEGAVSKSKNVGFKVLDQAGRKRRKRVSINFIDLNNDGSLEEILRTDEPIYRNLFNIALFESPLTKSFVNLTSKQASSLLSDLKWKSGYGFDLKEITIFDDLNSLFESIGVKTPMSLEYLRPEFVVLNGKRYILEIEYGKFDRFLFLSEFSNGVLVPKCVFVRE